MAKKGKKTIIKLDPSKLKQTKVEETPIKFYKTFEEIKLEQNSDQNIQNSDQNIQNSDQNIQNSDQNIQNSDQNIQNSDQNIQNSDQNIQNSDQPDQNLDNLCKIEQNLEIIKTDKKIEEIFLQEENADTETEEESFENRLREIIKLRNKDVNPQFYIEEKAKEEIIENTIKERDSLLKSRNIKMVGSKGRNKIPVNKISNKISINSSIA